MYPDVDACNCQIQNYRGMCLFPPWGKIHQLVKYIIGMKLNFLQKFQPQLVWSSLIKNSYLWSICFERESHGSIIVFILFLTYLLLFTF